MLKPYFHGIADSTFSSYLIVKCLQTISIFAIFNAILSSTLILISWQFEFKSKNGKVSFFPFMINRLWRIYPTVIAYFLIIGSFPLISSSGGPLMNYMQKGSVNLLIEHGWKQLLFISCFQPFKQMLMPIGWFISVDTQLYCLSFIVVYYMFNRPKLGLFGFFDVRNRISCPLDLSQFNGCRSHHSAFYNEIWSIWKYARDSLYQHC